MKSLKECDLCENVMKLMCLAPALGGMPDSGTKSDAFLAHSTHLCFPRTQRAGALCVCSKPDQHLKLLLEPYFLGRVSRLCTYNQSHTHARTHTDIHPLSDCTVLLLTPDTTEPSVIRFMGSLL